MPWRLVTHEDLLALAEGSGLILVTGPTGHGKTTAIEAVLGDPRCPPKVIFIGDIRGEVQDAFRAIQLARTQLVVGSLAHPARDRDVRTASLTCASVPVDSSTSSAWFSPRGCCAVPSQRLFFCTSGFAS